VQNFVVLHIPEGCADKANFLIVENTLDALQQFAAYYRSRFHFPVIGLTGSNGKTIVKEWLNFLSQTLMLFAVQRVTILRWVSFINICD
jgi:alanine racemase